MDNIPALLANLPPGTDVISYLKTSVDTLVSDLALNRKRLGPGSTGLLSQLFPDLGNAFYISSYIGVALCSAVIVTIAAGLYVRYRKQKLRFILADGAATRPNPRTVVPLIWLIMGLGRFHVRLQGPRLELMICLILPVLIVHTFRLRHAMKSKNLSFSLGVYWWMMASPLTCSYAVISTSVMCNAPIVRKFLMDFNHRISARRHALPSVILVNSTMCLVSIACICSAYIPGRLTGSGFRTVTEVYAIIMEALEQARITQNLALLASLAPQADRLAAAQVQHQRSTAVGGYIYTGHIVLFFLTGLIPAVFLNRYMQKHINRLDRGLASSQQRSSQPRETASMETLEVQMDEPVESLAGRSKENLPRHPYRVALPKDRPFTDLAPTSVVPTNYATILQYKYDPVEKASRLRAALKRDNLQLCAYFLMLSSLASLALFQASGGPNNYSVKKEYTVAYTWEIWCYLLPAFILSSAFLYDAIRNISGEDEVNLEIQSPSYVAGSRSFNVPPLAAIQLSQTVEVVEEHQLEEKKTSFHYA